MVVAGWMRCDDSFFFSSRRRHTRFDCDWSSDVYSSDLKLIKLKDAEMAKLAECPAKEPKTTLGDVSQLGSIPSDGEVKSRSEERRVGKECRSRWWPYQ